MKTRPGSGAALALLALLAGTAGAQDPAGVEKAGGGALSQAAVEVRLERQVAFDLMVFLPAGYEAEGDKLWPLILFLHGAGERGNDVRQVARHGPLKVAQRDPDFGFVVVAPQCPARSWWDAAEVIGLLDEVLKKWKVDPARVYLTGLSMGGYGTWSTGLRYPDRFAAIAPICGGGATPDVLRGLYRDAAALRNLPVWAFHGARDRVVPLEESERMVAALKRAGNEQVELTVYPDARHDAWTRTYAQASLYEWFLEHHR